MNSEHFSYFRIKNFKRFKDLEVKNIGQFNLVLGDNNVGKTSLLEALMWEPSMHVYQEKLSHVLFRKYKNYTPNEDVLKHFYRIESLQDSPHFMEVNLKSNIDRGEESCNFIYEFDFKNHRVIESYDGKSNSIELSKSLHTEYDLPLIPFSFSYNHKMVSDFSMSLGRNIQKRKTVVKSLSKLFEGVINLETDNYTLRGQPTIRVWVENKPETLPLEFFGDGFLKLFAILLKIMKESQNIVLIDEVDAGIHYSRQKDFWIGILDFASENNVQFFATTHNRECIEAYQQALEELGREYQDKTRTIRLVEHAQTKDIVAFTNSYDKMTEEILIGNEIR